MWELIEANKRKSVILFAGMGICLALLGYFLGAVFLAPDGGIIGIFVGLGIWVLLSLVSYFLGDSLILAVSRAKEVSHDVHPRLFHVVEEMKIAAGLPAMPRVYIIDDAAPNAFAAGTRPERSAISVTAGLLSRLNRDELQGVIAHEMSHIANRDVLFVTFAGVMLGTIVILSEVFLRGRLFRSGSSRRYRSGSGGGQAYAIIMVVALVLAILAPIFARLFYFAISRRREYLADASAVRLTRYPEGLASALEKVSSVNLDLASANKVTAPMYIVNPLKKRGMRISNLTSTHPPISERIRILRSMVQGASYSDYQKTFSSVKGGAAAIIPASGLREAEVVPLRKPTVEKEEEPGKKKGMRDFGDLMRAVNKYAFMICACGLKVKLPPDFKKSEMSCPRCGREIQLPLAGVAPITGAVGSAMTAEDIKEDSQAGPAGPRRYTRKGRGWETFSCSCGRLLQISPAFEGSHLVCSSCGRKTEITG